jgi:DNA-binding XRE family transcriptional regulator
MDLETFSNLSAGAQRRIEDEIIALGPDEPDALDEVIAESTGGNPEFPRLLDRAMALRHERDALLAEMRQTRQAHKVRQRDIAARMGVSQALIARLERGDHDPHLSTLQRYAQSLGKHLEWHLVDAGPGSV